MPKIYEILTENHLKLIIDKHLILYSRMQPIDAYKLLYQALYGPAHMMQDFKVIKANILQELSDITGNSNPLLIDIGENLGYARINFPLFMDTPDPELRNIRLDILVNWILTSCEEISDNYTTLHTHWHNLLPYLKSKFFATDSQWDETSQMVFENVIPSHSPIYKELYHPHYRIVKPTLIQYSDLHK